MRLFHSLQHTQKAPEQNKPDSEEQESAGLMQASEEEPGIDVDGQQGKSGDTDAVLHYGHRQDSHPKNRARPAHPQEKIPRGQARNGQSDARTDAAAFASYFDRDAGQIENQALAGNWCHGQMEKPGGKVRTDPHCNQVIRRSSAEAGGGIINIRKARGNRAARNVRQPNAQANPAQRKIKKLRTYSASDGANEVTDAVIALPAPASSNR